MAPLNHPTSAGFARRLLAALAILTLTAPTAPALALRAGLEQKVERQVGEALTIAGTGLEEDFSRFEATIWLLSDYLGEQGNQLFDPGYESYREGLASMKAGDFATAVERFTEANARWKGLRLYPDSQPPSEGRTQLANTLALGVSALAYARGRNAAGSVGKGLEYYATAAAALLAYSEAAAGQQIHEDLVRAVARAAFPKALGPASFVTIVTDHRVPVFVMEGVSRGYTTRLDVLQEGASRRFYRQDAHFQPFVDAEKHALPVNAVVITNGRRPAGLRPDIAAVSIYDVMSFEDLLSRALAYQLGQPVTMFDMVVIGNKTFIFA